MAKLKRDPEIEDQGPRRLSHSSSGVLLGCERRYWHKVHETEFDIDYDDDRKALRIGNGFHKVLELCVHRKDKFSAKLFYKALKIE
ncbi:unnamed protein product, partial [marine sediment metagenome]